MVHLIKMISKKTKTKKTLSSYENILINKNITIIIKTYIYIIEQQ